MDNQYNNYIPPPQAGQPPYPGQTNNPQFTVNPPMPAVGVPINPGGVPTPVNVINNNVDPRRLTKNKFMRVRNEMYGPANNPPAVNNYVVPPQNNLFNQNIQNVQISPPPTQIEVNPIPVQEVNPQLPTSNDAFPSMPSSSENPSNPPQPVASTVPQVDMRYIEWYLENKVSVDYHKTSRIPTEEEINNYYNILKQQQQQQQSPPSSQPQQQPYQQQQQPFQQPSPPSQPQNPPPQQPPQPQPTAAKKSPAPANTRKNIKKVAKRRNTKNTSGSSSSDSDSDSGNDKKKKKIEKNNKNKKGKRKSTDTDSNGSDSDSDSDSDNEKKKKKNDVENGKKKSSDDSSNNKQKPREEDNKKEKIIDDGRDDNDNKKEKPNDNKKDVNKEKPKRKQRRKFSSSSSSSSSDEEKDNKKKKEEEPKKVVQQQQQQQQPPPQPAVKKDPKFIPGTAEYEQHMREFFGEEYLNQQKERAQEESESLAQYYKGLIESDELADVPVEEYLIGCEINSAGLYDCPMCDKKDIEGKNMFSLKCSHKCCFDCYKKYVEKKIKDEKATYQTNCDEKFTFNILKYLDEGLAVKLTIEETK